MSAESSSGKAPASGVIQLAAGQMDAIRRFPLAWCLFLLLFVICAVFILDDMDESVVLEIALGGLGSAAIGSLALSVLAEGRAFSGRLPGNADPVRLNILWKLAPGALLTLLVLTLFSFATTGQERAFLSMFLVPASLLLLVASLLRPGAAFPAARDEETDSPQDQIAGWKALLRHGPRGGESLLHWHCARRDLTAVFFAGLLSFLIMLGVFAAVAAVSFLLLENENFEKLYLIIFQFCSLLLFPSLAMSGLMKPGCSLEAAPETPAADEAFPGASALQTPAWLRVVTAFILLPLALAYMVILYLWLVQIMLFQEWPENGVGLFIAVYLAFGLAVHMACRGLARSGPGWLRLYHRFFPLAVLPLALALVLAAVQRIHAYGVTEPRYLLLLFTVWLLAVSVALLLRPVRQYLLPLSLAVLLGLASFGPWGARSLSLSSQKAEFVALLEEAGYLDPETGKLDISGEASAEVNRRLDDIFDFFRDRESLAELDSLFAGSEQGTVPDDLFSRRELSSPFVDQWLYLYGATPEVTDISGFERTFTISLHRTEEEPKVFEGTASLQLLPEQGRLLVTDASGTRTVSLDLDSLWDLDKPAPKEDGSEESTSRTLSENRSVLEGRADGFRVRLRLGQIIYQRSPGGKRKVENMQGNVYLVLPSTREE